MMFIGLVFYITDGKAVFLFYTTQLPCGSRVIILSTISYHRSDVIYSRQSPGCMPGCLDVGAILISLNFRGCNVTNRIFLIAKIVHELVLELSLYNLASLTFCDIEQHFFVY